MENIYVYVVKGQAKGIVIANDEIDAERKIREAYEKHDTLWNNETERIEIVRAIETFGYFSDSPDVLEIADFG